MIILHCRPQGLLLQIEVMKDAAAAWKQLSDEEREPFMAIAEGVCPHLYAFLTVNHPIHSGSEFGKAVRHLRGHTPDMPAMYDSWPMSCTHGRILFLMRTHLDL